MVPVDLGWGDLPTEEAFHDRRGCTDHVARDHLVPIEGRATSSAIVAVKAAGTTHEESISVPSMSKTTAWSRGTESMAAEVTAVACRWGCSHLSPWEST